MQYILSQEEYNSFISAKHALIKAENDLAEQKEFRNQDIEKFEEFIAFLKRENDSLKSQLRNLNKDLSDTSGELYYTRDELAEVKKQLDNVRKQRDIYQRSLKQLRGRLLVV